MNAGIIKNLSNEDYHDEPAISRSGIMMFAESPFKYWANYIDHNRPEKKSTEAMEFGSAFHMFVLEGELFIKNYVVEPELLKLPQRVLLKDVGRTAYDAYKAEKAKIDYLNEKIEQEFEEQTLNRKIISQENLDELNRMKIALLSHHEARDLILGGRYEESYFWVDEKSGLGVKARPDILHENMIVDIKTCNSASFRAYQRAMVDGGYHIQGAMIQDAVKAYTGRYIETVINICIEKTYPYCIGIKIISEDALEEGRRRYRDILLEMKKCFDTNEWPSYEIENVDLPGWY